MYNAQYVLSLYHSVCIYLHKYLDFVKKIDAIDQIAYFDMEHVSCVVQTLVSTGVESTSPSGQHITIKHHHKYLNDKIMAKKYFYPASSLLYQTQHCFLKDE